MKTRVRSELLTINKDIALRGITAGFLMEGHQVCHPRHDKADPHGHLLIDKLCSWSINVVECAQ